MEDKKVPRVIRNLDTSQRRVHFNEKILLVPREVEQKRLEICNNCKSYENYGCTITGYFMPKTVRNKSQSCPYGKWTSWYSFNDNFKDE